MEQTACCICAQQSAQGTRDKAGRFVCADCLERARQTIMLRKAREARAKESARTEAEVARAESDNSEVLTWRSALDPALALLCPNCGRMLHLDVGACHACGYGLQDQGPHRRFAWLGRGERNRRPSHPHLLDMGIPWLAEVDPRLEGALPIVAAVLLWTMTALGLKHHAALVAADVLVTGLLALLSAWFVGALFPRSKGVASAWGAAMLASTVLVLLDPVASIPAVRWSAVTVLLASCTGVVWLRARGVFVALWCVAAGAGAGLIAVHAIG